MEFTQGHDQQSPSPSFSPWGAIAPPLPSIPPPGLISELSKVRQVLRDVIGVEHLNFIDPAQDHGCQVQLLSTGNFNLICLHWQGALRIVHTQPESAYLIYLVCEGSTTVQVDQYLPIECGCDTVATICSPGQNLVGTTNAKGFTLLISLKRTLVDQALTDLLGRPPTWALVFEPPTIQFTHGLGCSLKQFSQFLWEEALGGAAASPVVMEELERAFLACLVKGLPHNYSDRLLQRRIDTLTCYAKKAQSYMAANLQKDIRLEEVATMVGVSPRMLEKAFAYHCHCSPMQFLKQARLERIHADLCSAPRGTKITEVMINYGFTQGGKFASAYRKMFGELPSQTLKRHHSKS